MQNIILQRTVDLYQPVDEAQSICTRAAICLFKKIKSENTEKPTSSPMYDVVPIGKRQLHFIFLWICFHTHRSVVTLRMADMVENKTLFCLKICITVCCVCSSWILKKYHSFKSATLFKLWYRVWIWISNIRLSLMWCSDWDFNIFRDAPNISFGK